MFRAIVSVYSRIYKFLPLPARRASRFIYRSFGGGNTPDRAGVDELCSIYRSLGIIGKADLVFDIGANVGTYSLVFARLCSRVVSVEPEPSCLAILEKKFRGSGNVTVVPMGVGEANGWLDLQVSGTRVASTFSKDFMKREEMDFKTDYIRTVRVEVTTLDWLISRYGLPKYCKIDVEGFEPQVLSGLSRPIQLISFEFHSSMEKEAEFCLRLLEKRGYSFNFLTGNRFDSKRWLSADESIRKIRQMGIGGVVASGDIFARLGKAGETGPGFPN